MKLSRGVIGSTKDSGSFSLGSSPSGIVILGSHPSTTGLGSRTVALHLLAARSLARIAPV